MLLAASGTVDVADAIVIVTAVRPRHQVTPGSSPSSASKPSGSA